MHVRMPSVPFHAILLPGVQGLYNVTLLEFLVCFPQQDQSVIKQLSVLSFRITNLALVTVIVVTHQHISEQNRHNDDE